MIAAKKQAILEQMDTLESLNPLGAKGPTRRSYWVKHENLSAGAYPGDASWKDGDAVPTVVSELLASGVEVFVNLTEDKQGGSDAHLTPYDDFVTNKATVERHSITDLSVPTIGQMVEILDSIDDSLSQNKHTYIHCWGGLGRTGVVVGCWLIRNGFTTPSDALTDLNRLRIGDAEAGHRRSPQTQQQDDFVESWMIRQ